jgi:hypothetical protein
MDWGGTPPRKFERFMPKLDTDELERIQRIELNCEKLAVIESITRDNKAQVAKILRILVGEAGNGEKPGLMERVRNLEDFQVKSEQSADDQRRSFKNLRNTIIGGIIVGVFLTIINLFLPVLAK